MQSCLFEYPSAAVFIKGVITKLCQTDTVYISLHQVDSVTETMTSRPVPTVVTGQQNQSDQTATSVTDRLLMSISLDRCVD